MSTEGGWAGIRKATHNIKLLAPGRVWEALWLAVLAVAAGGAVMLFHALTFWIENHTLGRLERARPWQFVIGSFACVLGGSFLASSLIRWFAPSAGGGGVLPVKLAFWRDSGVMRKREAIVKLFGSALTLGSGVSMGPEGPSIQIGAATMSAGAGSVGAAGPARRAWCAAGAAAGLAAVFNAPLAAITFVLEEIIGDLHSRLLGRVVVAAVVGALVGHAVLGPQPAFQSAPLSELTWRAWVCVPLVGLVAGAGGACFQKLAMALRRRVIRPPSRPGLNPYRPMLGAAISWAVAILVYLLTGHAGVFGIGYGDITDAIAGRLAVPTLAVLCLGKILATAGAVGTSGCGGIFAPSLFIGAMSGGAIAGLAARLLHLSGGEASMLVMVGMAASLGAVIRTPLTCVLLLFEVTNQWVIVPALMLAAVVSQIVARLVNHEDMYEAIMKQDGVDPNQVLPPRHFKRWTQIPVSTLATAQPVILRAGETAEWPAELQRSPHMRYPVAEADGRVTATVERREIQRSLQARLPPHLDLPHWIDPDATVGAARRLMLASGSDFLCVGREAERRLEGVLTLHDLLRGESVLDEDG